MNFAILRTAKLSHFGNIGASAKHNLREMPVPNADAERTQRNTATGAQTAAQVVESVKARLDGLKVRKNAVLAVEYFIGASPEWFYGQRPDRVESYFDEAEKWLKTRHGAENVVCCIRQYDETSPHMSAYVVPIDSKGNLNARSFLGGRDKLSQMQTDFAEQVGREFGLERGIEGSRAHHTTVKEYYAAVNAPTPELRTQIPAVEPPTAAQRVAEVVGMPTDHSRAVEAAEEARRARLAEGVARRQAEEAKAKQFDLERKSQEARNCALTELRAVASYARAIPLERVLEGMGCTKDPKDRNNWITPAGRLTVTGAKFYAHDAGQGGGGAIDLVKLLDQCDYKAAVHRLAEQFAPGQIVSDQVAQIKPIIEEVARQPQQYQAPEPVPENWPRVRHYLTEIRRLGGEIVDYLHDVKRLYADRFSNAVFVLGRGEGVELRGTGEASFHGVRGSKKPFALEDRGEPSVAFVESAIDAISLHGLGFQGKIISTGGSSSQKLQEWAALCRERGLKIVAAFDNDRAGEAMARQLGDCERKKPQFKDWNDDLKFSRMTDHERQQHQANQQQAELKRDRGRGMSR